MFEPFPYPLPFMGISGLNNGPWTMMPPPPPPPQIGRQSDGPAQLRKLFIGGLCRDTSDIQLYIHFSRWGRVVDAIVMRDPHTKVSRGFGFVTFGTVFDAEMAMSATHHRIGGRKVDLKRAVPRSAMDIQSTLPFLNTDPRPPGCKLSISGIIEKCHSVDVLRVYFESFGALDQVEIVKNEGSGFVVFVEKECADLCLASESHVINDREVIITEFKSNQCADIPKIIDEDEGCSTASSEVFFSD